MTLLRRLAALARRFLRRRKPPPRLVGLYAGDDNQVYVGLLSGGTPTCTLAQTSAGPCRMRFGRIG